MKQQKCPECYGYGYTECVAYYYGRAECSFCGGLGVVDSNGEPFADADALEAALLEPEAKQ